MFYFRRKTLLISHGNQIFCRHTPLDHSRGNSAGKQGNLNLQQSPRAPTAWGEVLPKYRIKLSSRTMNWAAHICMLLVCGVTCIWGVTTPPPSPSPSELIFFLLIFWSNCLAWVFDKRLTNLLHWLCRHWGPGWHLVRALQEPELIVVLLSFKGDTWRQGDAYTRLKSHTSETAGLDNNGPGVLNWFILAEDLDISALFFAD